MSRIPEGTIIAATGLLRMGKTMMATRIAYSQHLEGRKVYANYDTVFSTRLENVPQLFKIDDGSVLVLDELQATLDSREFSKNVELTHWLTMIGKNGISLIYTVQSFMMVDVRVRQLTGFLYFAQRKFTGRDGGTRTLFNLYQVFATGDAILRKRLVMPHRPLYGLYDTRDKNVVLSVNEGAKAVNPMERAADRAQATDNKKAGNERTSEPRERSSGAPRPARNQAKGEGFSFFD